MKQKVKDKLEKRSTELLVLSAIIVVGGAVATASSSNILDAGASSEDGLVAEYRFDTEAGNTAYDTSGNNDGTINGASWTSGVKGGALEFDGNDDTVNVGNDLPQSAPLTVTGWMYIDSSHSNEADMVGNYDGNGWIFRVRPSNNNRMELWFGGNGHASSSNAVTERDRWVYLTVTLDENGEITYYKNGRKIDTVTTSGSITSTSNDFRLGSRGDSDTRNDLLGKLDQVKVYSESLNQSQIKSMYNSGSWRIGTVTDEDDPSKVAEFSFQHQNSSHVLDTSGYNNHGQKKNGVKQVGAVECKVGRCYSFDESASGGNGQYVDIDPAAGLSDDEITAMAWIKPKSSTDSRAPIVRADQFYFQHYNDNRLATYWYGWNHEGYHTSTADSVPTGEWTHVAVTWDSTDGVQFYINGKKDNRVDNTGPGDSNNWIQIGQENGGRRFNGKIDQVKIFNRSLSQQEIISKTQGLESNGAVLDMRFDSSGGDHVEDYSMENNHGSLNPDENSGPERVDGLSGEALNFDGGDDYVSVPDSSDFDLGNGDVAWSFWMHPDDVENIGRIFMKRDSYQDREISSYVTNGDIIFRILDSDNGNDDVSLSSPVKANEWYHVVGLREDNQLRLYVNGELKDSGTGQGSITSLGDIQIGRRSGTAQMFDGKIDMIKSYPYSITESKIQNLYSQGKSSIDSSSSSSNSGLQDGLVLSQTFDRVETCGQSDTVSCPSGMSGEVSVDESGEANHGELVNEPTVKGAKDCKFGGCLELDGSDDFTTHDMFGSGFGDSHSVFAWVKTEETPFDSWDGVIEIDGSGNNVGFYIGGKSGQNSIRVHHRDFSPNNGIDFGDLSDGKWHLVGFSFDNSSSPKARYYFDGEQKATANIDQGDYPSSLSEVTIGQYHGHNWNGSIDQVRVYNRSLSKEEVWKLYTRGRDRETGMAGPVGWWRISSESSPLPDVSGEGNDGDLNLLGETGTFNTSDGEWKTVRFERSYEDPVVVGTTNTKVGESAIYFETRNVQSHKAEMRLCESEGGNSDGCDSHGTERAGYIVVDAASTDDIPGIEAGSFPTSDGGDSFSESFSTTPVVFSQPQSDNSEGEVVSWTTYRDTSGFNVQVCDQDSTNGCTSPGEEIGWIAVEPGNEPFEQLGEADNLSSEIGSSNWGTANFDSSFSERPVGVFSVQNNDGGQDPKVDEIRNVGTSSMEMRFCELETGDTCDGHATMEYAYLAVEEGLLTYSNGNFPRYVDTERGKALEFDGSDDSVEVKKDFSYQDVTFTAWVKADDLSDGWILNKFANKGDGWGLKAGSGGVSIYDDIDGVDNTYYQTDLDGSWHHVAIAMKESENYLYVDGRKQGSGKTSSSTLSSFSGNLYVAQRGTDANYFDGKIDDIRIYPYTLTQEQVKQVKNGGAVSVG